MTPSATRIFGPLVSTGWIEEQERLFVDVFGMEQVERHDLDAELAGSVFGASHGSVESAQVVVLRTPGVESGVVLVQFDPVCAETIRTWESRGARDVLKVIDFYAPDYEAAVARARRLGHRVIDAQAAYELPQGTFREAHLWGPDNVVTAFLGGPSDFFADFAQVTDAEVSEVQSISAPLGNTTATVEFYREVFGWPVVFEYEVDDPSFAAMVGLEGLVLRSRNVGPSTREPYFGLIDYGVVDEDQDSLRNRARAPRRGLLGAVLVTDDLAGTVRRAGAAAGEVVDVDLLGRSQSCLVLPPHGVPHVVLGTPSR